MNLVKFSFILLLITLLNACSSTYYEASRNGCLGPAANYYTQDAINFNERTKTYQYQSPLVFVKIFKSMFGKQLELEDRCKHTEILTKALNNPNDLQSYSWENKKLQTFGKVKILKTKPRPQSFNGEVCRDYISFIGIKDKVKKYGFRACNYRLSLFDGAPVNSQGFTIPPLSNFGGWEFYNLNLFG
tara:strand:+ start:3062 stop:3622 length:561 start_codon:yes stop_codon:yes gene_type:complete